MKKKHKYLLALAVVVGGLIYLFFLTFQSSLQYDRSVSEIAGHEVELVGRILRVAGQAKNIQIQEEEASAVYEFELVEGEKVLLVRYTGIVPDTFKEGASVVVTGELLLDGTLRATGILTKCASKYEAKVSGQ